MNKFLEAVSTIQEVDKFQGIITEKHNNLYKINKADANNRMIGDTAYYVVDTASISNNCKLKTHSLNQIATIEVTNHNTKVSCHNWDYIHRGGKKASFCMAGDYNTFDSKDEALIYIIEKQLYWLSNIISHSIKPGWGSQASWIKGLEYSIDKMEKNYTLKPELYDRVITNLLGKLS